MLLGSTIAASLVGALLAAPASGHVQAPLSPAGRVKAATAPADIVRRGQVLPAAVGMEVFETDLLRTGAGGQLAVMLKDETRLSLGPDTEASLQQFSFAPAEGRMGMVLRVMSGVVSYISGRMARLNPSSVRIETPSSVIAVRGTHALVRVEAP